MGIVLFSGAIIISLLAMRGRAPQWLLMFCCGWTLFTLLNVTWQPLMVFQLALIWGGYAFLAPQGLSQRKLWKSGSLEAVQNEVMNRAKGLQPDPASTPVQTAIHSHRSFGAAESNIPILNDRVRNKGVNKTFITRLFIIILAINIAAHLYPFNYPSILVTDEIARAMGSTLGIFLLALIGRLFKPSKTFGMAFIAILVTPFAILLDRANDPVAPREFRELFRSSDDMEIALPLPDGGEGNMPMTDSGAISLQYDGNVTEQDGVNTGAASTSAPAYPASENANDGPSDYQRNLDLYIKADPILSPETYDTSDMPDTKAANAELARRRLEASKPETASNEQPYTPYP